MSKCGLHPAEERREDGADGAVSFDASTFEVFGALLNGEPFIPSRKRRSLMESGSECSWKRPESQQCG
ncbi:hypothetical protein PO124_23650 [Bacillus licheniformis]|nr:hypothetical protein [Bacillus licheniformis]